MNGVNTSIRYHIEPADQLMCVPACLNMVFSRRDLTPYKQSELGVLLGLVVPPELATKYPGAKVDQDISRWGVHPQEVETSVDTLFEKLNIPLRHYYYPISQIPAGSFIDFLSDNIKLDNDVIIGFDYLTVYGEGSHVGHVCLLDGVDDGKNLVHLVDPDASHGGVKSVVCTNLIQGIMNKRDGIWVITDSSRIHIPTPF